MKEKKSMKARVASLVIAVGVLAGGVGVYAGTVIDSYKTPRGNTATIENEVIHKNRIGLSLNGKDMKLETWYGMDKTFVPVRQVVEAMGGKVHYNEKTYNTDIAYYPIPPKPDGTYEGMYTDATGLMRAKLTIKGDKGTVEFQPDKKNKKGSAGSYDVSVRYNGDTGLIEVTAGKWKKQSKKNQRVEFKGGMNHKYINGSVIKTNYTFSFMKK